MGNPRLSEAVAAGDVVLPPQGRIALYHPRAGLALDGLPLDRLHVIQPFRPDHDSFAAQGVETSIAPEGDYAAAVVFVPRARDHARALIADAAARVAGGPLIVDGQKTDGIDGLLRELRRHGSVGGVTSRAHGKLIVLEGGDFAGWADPGPRDVEGFATRLGVFSADGPDRGSVLLAEALPALRGQVADLGAGWGYLSRAILESGDVAQLHLVEADAIALSCARENVTDPRAAFHWVDATTWRPDAPLDAVVTNPPFHNSRAADPGLGRAFLASAAACLKPQGVLWLVANRHLPYERALSALFRDTAEVAGDGAFKVLRAARPVQAAGRGRTEG